MEAAGVDPEVQVLVQGEFSRTQLAIDGCGTSQTCFNRPNYNSFRYQLRGTGTPVPGPNGATDDLGSNRNFTDPSELNAFVRWAKQTAPAERYAVVLWNHGGGYAGLLQDETSANGGFMLPGQLPTALAGVGKIDVLELDMCLMGDYSTLSVLAGLADNVVFSQAVDPSPGQNYQRLLDAIQGASNSDGKAIASAFADAFNAEYAPAARRSITQSAFDMSLFGSFDADLSTLATTLRTNLPALRPVIAQASALSQKFEYPGFTDLLTFIDSLAPRIADAGIQTQIAAVRNGLTNPDFLLRSHAKTASVMGFGQGDVSRARGLSVVLPSGIGADQFQADGPLSLNSYRVQFPGKAWTEFLTDYATGQGASPVIDQGIDALEVYLTWRPEDAAAGTDLDLWVVEPTGDIFIPFRGIVTPNGTFTGDSYDQSLFYEGYLTRQMVMQGAYLFYGDLWIDPQSRQPIADIQYWLGQTAPLTSLYAPNFPQFSLTTSWLNDPTPTFEEVNAGAYSDLRLMATYTFGPGAAAFDIAAASFLGRQAGRALTVKVPAYATLPTTAQLMTLRRLREPGAARNRVGILGSRARSPLRDAPTFLPLLRDLR